MSTAERPRVVIVGGGVAGMTAALELSETPCEVILVESGPDLGGKFGGTPEGDVVHEHGYHLFADYTVNFLDLMARLGLGHTLVPREAIRYLRRGEFPAMTELRNTASERYFWTNAHNGPVAWPDFVLYAYSMLELADEDIEQADFLDLVSVNGYLASRPYMTVDAALLHQQSLLKTLSLASYRTAISSYQRWVINTLSYPEPMLRVMTRNSLDGFIRPLAALLESRGVRIVRRTRASRVLGPEGARRVTLEPATTDARDRLGPLGGGSGADGVPGLAYDALVLAVPIEAMFELLDDDLFAATWRPRVRSLLDPPHLSSVRRLETAPMASLDIRFRHRIPGMPEEHVTFLQSEFDLSCIDLSQLWQTGEETYLNAVATNTEPLAGLSEAYAERLILEEVLAFLGQPADAVASVTYRDNRDAPLFLNEVGSWYDRPEVATPLPWLVLAGDYIRNSFGIASVEGAIVSAKEAAARLIAHFGFDHTPRVLQPRRISRERIARRLRILEPSKARALAALRASPRPSTAGSRIFE